MSEKPDDPACEIPCFGGPLTEGTNVGQPCGNRPARKVEGFIPYMCENHIRALGHFAHILAAPLN